VRRVLCLLLILGLALGAPTAALAVGSGHAASSGSSASSAGSSASAGSSGSGSGATGAPATGGSSPFAPGLPPSASTTPTSTAPRITTSAATSTSGNNSGLSGSGIIAIVIGALIVLGGVSVFIWRDARRHAPARAGAGGPLTDRSKPGSKRPPKPRKLSPAERRRRKRGRSR
jgi:hypothetical protein